MTLSGTGPSLQRLGRYHLSECLGGGPTGEVYRAKVYGVAGMDREFAVKRFHASYADDPKAAAEIAVAARMYGALEHPQVARLQEFGVAEGNTFTATEYVDGLDLSQLIAHGRLPLGTAARLVVQTGRTVGYAHGRGLSHLGLCPTNIICTERGEIRVTDFGFLPSRLPSKPVEDASLFARLCYLAPEQLEGQATSPATDVYQLGVIAFEIMVGHKPYEGTGRALAEQIIRSETPESGLDKPFQKLLKRALARSPFERYPDTGAMADALEAALRSTPVPGSLMDAGKAVKARRGAQAEQRAAQASGALSFPIPAPPRGAKEEVLAATATPPPIPQIPSIPKIPEIPKIKRAASDVLAHTQISPVPEPGLAPAGPAKAPLRSPLQSPAQDPDSITGMHTIPRIELGVAEDTQDQDADTDDILLGPAGTDIAASREQFIGGVEPRLSGELGDEDETRVHRGDDEETRVRGGDEEATRVRPDETESGRRERAGSLDDAQTVVRDEKGAADEASLESLAMLEDVSPGDDAADSPHRAEPSAEPLELPDPPELAEPPELAAPPAPAEPLALAGAPDAGAPRAGEPVAAGEPAASEPADLEGLGEEVSELLVMPPGGPLAIENPPMPMAMPQSPVSPLQGAPREVPPSAMGAPRKRVASGGGRRGPLYLLLFAIMGAGSYFAYGLITGDSGRGSVAAGHGAKDAQAPVASPSMQPGQDAAGGAAARDAGGAEDLASPVAGQDIDAGATVASDLQLDSDPEGAKVYLDGTLVGKTPLRLDASPDDHRLALVLPGYELYTGEIEGRGRIKIDLGEVTPPEGPAGIKVRCRKKNRYYVFVDGNSVGQLCPTERIGVDKGKHLVEIYDPITDSRRSFRVEVVDTRLSLRVRVD